MDNYKLRLEVCSQRQTNLPNSCPVDFCGLTESAAGTGSSVKSNVEFVFGINTNAYDSQCGKSSEGMYFCIQLGAVIIIIVLD